MGAPMAAHLAPAGAHLTLLDAAPGRAREIADSLGAEAAENAAALAGCDLVILMLPSSVQVEDVLLGQGLLDALPDGALVLDMGSSDPNRTVALAERAAARGVDFVDAPVSGGVRGARAATLAIMVGGAPEAAARAHPVLALLGGAVTRVGGPGAGHAMKALNNLLSAVGILAAAEVLAVGTRFGLEPKTMLDVLNGSTGRNHATETKFERHVLSRAFDSGFSMNLMVKDLSTALSLPGARDGGASALLAVTRDAWAAALDTLGAGADHTELARYVETLAGVDLR